MGNKVSNYIHCLGQKMRKWHRMFSLTGWSITFNISADRGSQTRRDLEEDESTLPMRIPRDIRKGTRFSCTWDGIQANVFESQKSVYISSWNSSDSQITGYEPKTKSCLEILWKLLSVGSSKISRSLGHWNKSLDIP